MKHFGITAIVIFIFAFATASCQPDQNHVLICKGKSSYAYHKTQCQGLKQCRADIEKVSLSYALSLGRKACGYCYNNGSAAPEVKKPAMQPASKQCTAITKKGARCSRTARPDGRCWQHGG